MTELASAEKDLFILDSINLKRLKFDYYWMGV